MIYYGPYYSEFNLKSPYKQYQKPLNLTEIHRLPTIFSGKCLIAAWVTAKVRGVGLIDYAVISWCY